MIFEEFLGRTIHQYFDSMFQKYGYSYFGNKESQRNIHYFFRRPDRLVDIFYNYTNEFLEVNFYKEVDTGKLIGADFIGLIDIMRDKVINYNYLDYKAIMPSKIPLEKSLETLSELLEKYASTYLDGSEWKTWRDIQ